MKFFTTNTTDIVCILVLMEALEKGITTEEVDVYDYLNLTESTLIEMLNEKAPNFRVNV